MGVLAFLLLWGGSLALRKGVSPNEAERVSQRSAQSPCEASRAMATVKRLAEAPADPDFLTGRLRSAGLHVQRIVSTLEAGKFTHILGIREGRVPGNILLLTPYTPARPGIPGANSAASGTALLLELARVLPEDWTQHTLWLVFLDGVYGDAGGTGGTGGTGELLMESVLQASPLVERWRQEPTAAIYLAGPGDCYLGFQRDQEAPQVLTDILWESAARFLLTPHFQRSSRTIAGPAAALRAGGIPAVALVDLVYGGSLNEHKRLWHTPEDTPAHVCEASLQAVGDVLYHSIPAMDAFLNGIQGTQ